MGGATGGEAAGRGAAFTLIEVNLAILLIAAGVLVLLALFPLGLKESEEGVMDTHEGMFAGYVLSGLEGNALSMTNWSDWADDSAFRGKVGLGLSLPASGDVWPEDGERVIRYTLSIAGDDPPGDGRLYTATLRVQSGKYGVFDELAHYYVTKLIYMGM